LADGLAIDGSDPLMLALHTYAVDMPRRAPEPRPGARLLIVDDDPLLCGEMERQLGRSSSWRVATAASAMAALKQIETARYDLILLDVDLPDLDGRELCRLVRRRGIATPIIMLTAAASDADAVLSLDAGADDYVAKPFSMPLLLARMRAQLRRLAESDAADFTVGPWSFRAGARQLIAEGRRRIILTRIEAEILKMLCRAGGELVERDTLLSAIWGGTGEARRHSLETHLYRLRQKIESDGGDRILLSEGTGYRLA
jgi:DNA-binding response OmpR family regulator